jgi:hypothetical protein
MPQPLNPHRPGTEAELVRHLADTIGEDVIAAMGTTNWEHSQFAPTAPPPANPEGVTPAPPPTEGLKADPQNVPQPVVANATDWEQFRDQNGLILGKYKDPVAAAQGMHSLLHMAKSALAERDALKSQVDQLNQRPPVTAVTVPASPAPPARNSKLEMVLKKAKEGDGLEPDDLVSLVEGLAEQQEEHTQQAIARQQEAVQREQQEWEQVDAYMVQNHRQSLRFADEMKLFVSTDPEVGRVYSRLLSPGDDAAKLDATLYLWQQYSIKHPETNDSPTDPAKLAEERALQANAQVRREEVEAERKHAGLLGTVASGAHEASDASVGPTREDIDLAAQLMKQTGDGRLWRALTIANSLDHPIFNP